VYLSLLALARRMLPLSYLLMSVMGPFFPGALRRMGVALEWQPVLVSVWLSVRVVTMVVLERWHGWHGRYGPLVLAAGALGGGFVACVLAPSVLGMPLLVAGLVAFGVGMGISYTAALYYVLEVGSHGAEAGGSHEALIGLGYTVGPGIGLAAALSVQAGLLPESAFDVVIAVSALGVTIAVAGVSAAVSHARTKRDRHRVQASASTLPP
jgi:MFS family permease